jgi:membrane-associated phospholipid phosphatase
MILFFSTLPRNLIDSFKGRMLIAHGIAITLTFILVMSGFDWSYFLCTRAPLLRSWMFPAVIIGGLLPIALPLILIALGRLTGNDLIRLTGWSVGQAGVIGGMVAAAYKAISGRAHPSHEVGEDLSQIFHFGFLRGGVFWGWPSSHTTIAFAMASTILTLFPGNRRLGYVAIAYAFYVGIGVSTTIHWFSDFAAGAILGAVVGVVVGRNFSQHFISSPNRDT